MAQENHLTRITNVVLEIGQFSGVEPEALLFAFQAIGSGTVLENAEVEIQRPPLLLYCSTCENEYAADLEDLSCPICQKEDFLVVQGREMTVKSITGEMDDGNQEQT